MILIGMITYLGFQIVPIIVIIHIARNASMYTSKSKITKGVTIQSKALARLLIRQHKGFNDHYITNVPSRYTFYYINKKTNTISKVGILSWSIGMLTIVMWCVSVHLFLFDINSSMMGQLLFVVLCVSIVLVMIDTWNKGSPRIQDCVDGEDIISRELFEKKYGK